MSVFSRSPNTGGSLGRHCTFIWVVVRPASVRVNNPENPVSGKTGVVAGGLIPVALEVVVFTKSPKLGLYALVSAVAGVLSAIAGASLLDNEPASQGPVAVDHALWTLSSGILVPLWSGNALCSSRSQRITFLFI